MNEHLERLHENLLRLKMNTAERIVDDILELAATREQSYVEVLDRLIGDEVESRRSSAVETRTKLAHLPARKRLRTSTWASSRRSTRGFSMTCARCASSPKAKRHPPRPPGVGKTHIAIGLGLATIEAGYSVYYISSAALVEKLKLAEERNRLDKTMKKPGFVQTADRRRDRLSADG